MYVLSTIVRMTLTSRIHYGRVHLFINCINVLGHECLLTAATAADSPSLGARAGWGREEKEIDYSNRTMLIFDNGGLGEVNEVASNYTIKVEVRRALRRGVEVRRILSPS